MTSATINPGQVLEINATTLTKAVANGKLSFVALFTVRTHRWHDDTAQGPLSALALFLSSFVPGLLLLQFIVINHEKLGMLNKQGHVRGAVTCAIWPASYQTSPTCPMAMQCRQAYCTSNIVAFTLTYLLVTCIVYPTILTAIRIMCTKFKRKKLILQAYIRHLICIGFCQP